MNIYLQQSLHGYLNGHQQLAASTDLSPEAKRLLLFQSDLSGPKPQKGFDTYLTAYPIIGSNYFAFARTWYAAEMPRPGCVWTHTLLIELVDVGKIPDLNSLLKLFRRPQVNSYSSYEQKITLIFDDLVTDYVQERSGDYDLISSYVYQYPFNSVVLESGNSERYETALIEVWSDQWPRLRRNFTFCSGSFDLKMLNNKLFDVQVMPQKAVNTSVRQHEGITVASKQFSGSQDWLDTIHHASKNQLRQFLWLFGSDMIGERANFPKLIGLYEKINEKSTNLVSLSTLVRELLPQPDQGKSFKTSIFGKSARNSKFSELDVLNFLLSEKDISHLNLAELGITERLGYAYENQNINIIELINMLAHSLPGRFDETLYELITIPASLAPEILEKNHFLIERVIERQPELVNMPTLWKTNLSTQRELLSALKKKHNQGLPLSILDTILQVQSEVIFDVERLYGQKVVENSLDWYNKPGHDLSKNWRDWIYTRSQPLLANWLNSHIENIRVDILLEIFQQRSSEWVLNLNINHNCWIDAYAALRISDKTNLPFISSLFLSKGIRNNIYGSEWIVTMAFNDVYTFAERSQLSNYWNIIPKDYDETDDQFDFKPLNILRDIFKTKKSHHVQPWDYCEMLTRTVCTKYYKHNWSPQSFLDTFKSESSFDNAIAFLLTKKRGIDFLEKIKYELFKSKRITAQKFQALILKEL